MTVYANKPAFNVREKLKELEKPSGVAGRAMLAADTVAEQQALIGVGRKNLIINGSAMVSQRGSYVTTSSQTFVDMGDPFNLSISPKFSNSKILIDVMLNPYLAGNSATGTYNIHNGSGQLGHASNGFGMVPATGGSSGQFRRFNINATDTASSTATITYRIYEFCSATEIKQ